MSASLAPSAAPTNSLRVWCDARHIYAELPSRTSPCILSFPRTGEGLSKVLGLIYGHGDNSASQPENYKPPRTKRTSPQSALAESILRRQGVLK